MKYSLNLFRTDEGQVAEELASLTPKHSQCSSDLKVPGPLSRQLSYPTAKGYVKIKTPLTGDQRFRLIEPQSRKTLLKTLPLSYWAKVYTCQTNIKN